MEEIGGGCIASCYANCKKNRSAKYAKKADKQIVNINMSQQIQEIDINDLVLWTENPRDPIDSTATDQVIADKAWKDEQEKWNLMKLAKEMLSHYDLSELPTVVYDGKKPIVYDGNRRMILAKLKHDCIKLDGFDKTKLPTIPRKIPCNVCSKEIAVQNVFRKHGDSGSWSPLDRDLFISKFMDEPKSTFLKLDEATGIISANPHLNKVFVKNEIFTNEKLRELGFDFEDNDFKSKHNEEESLTILNDISRKVASKTIDTRKNRGKVLEILDKENRQLIDKNSKNPLTKLTVSQPVQTLATPQIKRQAPRTKKKSPELFDGILYLKSGQVSDLYRDISDLYQHYLKYQNEFSQYFPSLIRMSMRLLAEAAATDQNTTLGQYLKTHFISAKSKLDSDTKTTLSTQNVSELSIEQLLHIGAHNYSAANNLDQTIAVSIILGKILEISHGK